MVVADGRLINVDITLRDFTPYQITVV